MAFLLVVAWGLAELEAVDGHALEEGRRFLQRRGQVVEAVEADAGLDDCDLDQLAGLLVSAVLAEAVEDAGDLRELDALAGTKRRAGDLVALTPSSE